MNSVTNPILNAEQRKKKQRLIRAVIIFCCLLIPLLAYFQHGLLRADLNLPVSSTVLVFALININGLLLLLMLYLILRNLVELFFERSQKFLGSRLRTRLVIAFVSLSLIPVAILFFVALRFISASTDYWFNAKVEESLHSSMKLMESILQSTSNQSVLVGEQLASLLRSALPDLDSPEALHAFFNQTLHMDMPGSPDSFLLFDPARKPVVELTSTRLPAASLPPIPSEALRQTAETRQTETLTHNTASGLLIQAVVPVEIQQQNGSQTWLLVVSHLIPMDQINAMLSVSKGITDYQQMVNFKAPIKLTQIIVLGIVSLLVFFGATWLGIKIARSLTDPISRLALATRRVAEGDLDFILEKENDDEMGRLVESFNSMIADLLASNRQLARTHAALQDSKEVAEQRRHYLETILKNVAAGVIALDENNSITTINRFAEELLSIRSTEFLGQDFHAVLPRQHAAIVEGFIQELLRTGKPSIERHLRVTIRRGETLSLQINVTRMLDDRGHPIGVVIVFDDLTNLEKAQRLAAWQEVARRIAHEIKNPLTPIKLSAQRLRKRYLDKIDTDQQVFDQCTNTIVQQVDEIKKLVSEFSEFARMPKLHREKQDLGRLVEDTVFLYREAHRYLALICQIEANLAPFPFDAVQIKRVLINLLDNAISVLNEGGSITISLEVDPQARLARLQVADDGPGISEEDKLRLFEPYFSTRKSGTGLGLAIAQTIVTEHGGRILVADNQPQGAVFIVELPLDT